MKTKALNRELLDEICDAAGIDYDAVRENYSGRAMYGATCIGVVGSEGDGAKFVIGLIEVLIERGDEESTDVFQLAYTLAGETRTDSMGRDAITYWPGLTYDGDPEPDEDEDEE